MSPKANAVPEEPGAPLQVQPGAYAPAAAKAKQPVQQKPPEELGQLQTPKHPPQPILTLVLAAQLAEAPERPAREDLPAPTTPAAASPAAP